MFSKAIVRPPGANFANGLTTYDRGAPIHGRTLEQHTAYCAALESCGLTLTHLEADERFPDSTFVEDTAVIVNPLGDAGATATAAILTRPGASTRAGEVESIAEVLSRHCANIHSIREPGTLDGGDICEARNHFFIGVSDRTNEAGARQLAELVGSYGYTSSFSDIRGVKNILHLKSGLAFLDNRHLVVIDELKDQMASRNYELVHVLPEEQYAANCIKVNDSVLIAAGYPIFEDTLQQLGYKTLAIEMTEFQKMDGGLSCLSLRF